MVASMATEPISTTYLWPGIGQTQTGDLSLNRALIKVFINNKNLIFLTKLASRIFLSICGATDAPVLDFWEKLLWISKPEWAPLFTFWQRQMWYTVPEIHLWCNTSAVELLLVSRMYYKYKAAHFLKNKSCIHWKLNSQLTITTLEVYLLPIQHSGFVLFTKTSNKLTLIIEDTWKLRNH